MLIWCLIYTWFSEDDDAAYFLHLQIHRDVLPISTIYLSTPHNILLLLFLFCGSVEYLTWQSRRWWFRWRWRRGTCWGPPRWSLASWTGAPWWRGWPSRRPAPAPAHSAALGTGGQEDRDTHQDEHQPHTRALLETIIHLSCTSKIGRCMV